MTSSNGRRKNAEDRLDWVRTTFGEVCTITRGSSPRPIINWISKMGTPWVKISDATGEPGRFISQTKEFIKNEGRGKSVVVHPGDLVVSNSATPGLPKFLKIEACIHDGWLLLRNFKGAIPEFLYYVVLNDRRELVGKGSGSIFTNLKTEILKSHEIALPSLPEQRRIADALGQIDDKIALNIARSRTLEDIAQAIFKSWFIDFDPVLAKMNGEEPKGMDASTASIFPSSMKESDSQPIPDGWKMGRLGDVLSTLEAGKRPRGGAQKSGVPSIGAESIRRIGQFNYSAAKYIPRDFFQSMPSGKVLPYDVLIYKDGAGAGSYVSMFGEGFPFEEFAINEHVFLARSKSVPQSYLFHWLNQDTQKALMVELAQKSAQPGLNQQDTKSIPILLPSNDVMQAFSQLVEPLIRAIMSYSLQNTTLESIRENLLPRLLSGELQIPEELMAS